jgi:hypothetical protein
VAEHTAQQFESFESKGQRPWAALKRRLDRESPDYATRCEERTTYRVARRLARQSSPETMDQHDCITEKIKAVLMPNNNMPSTASSAPMIRQCDSSISPEEPRVDIESTE